MSESQPAVFSDYETLVSVLSEILENPEEMYVALEDLRMNGGNTLYLLLSPGEVFRPLILFLYMNPYTEEVYGLGIMIPVSCGAGGGGPVFEEVASLARRVGGLVATIHDCSLVLKEPVAGERITDQILGVFKTVYGDSGLGRLRIVDYSRDFIEEVVRGPGGETV